ncbi:MAG: hypothetical protein ACKESB_03420 [Candidatus Hodgkinia cicadicola]
MWKTSGFVSLAQRLPRSHSSISLSPQTAYPSPPLPAPSSSGRRTAEGGRQVGGSERWGVKVGGWEGREGTSGRDREEGGGKKRGKIQKEKERR